MTDYKSALEVFKTWGAAELADKTTYEAIRRALELAADPEYVYVPREPSEEIITAGLDAYYQYGFRDIYKAMITAATNKPRGDK